MRIFISSAHGKFVGGASGVIDENTESRRVVSQVVTDLRAAGAEVTRFDDDTSRTQGQNISTIVGAHNRAARDLDVSIHFNAFSKTTQPRGTETLYRTQRELAAKVSRAISQASGLIDRGAKHRTNLGFLNRTNKPAILIEVCFVDSTADVKLYQEHFAAICQAIAGAIA